MPPFLVGTYLLSKGRRDDLSPDPAYDQRDGSPRRFPSAVDQMAAPPAALPSAGAGRSQAKPADGGAQSSGWNSAPWTPPADGRLIKTQSVFGDVHLRHRDLAPTERADFSPLHQDILRNEKNYEPDSGVHEWNSMDAARYLAGKDIFPFKDQWVRGYRAAIIAAANRWDIPPALLAGVAYNEVGGDPAWADGAAFELRKVIANGKPADRTSFGDVSIQLRRAAQSLGYGDNPTPAQIAAVRASLQNPVQNLFIVAKHLSDLRDSDFRGTPASKLTPEQIEIIGARYNRGPDAPLASIRQHLSYGKNITKRLKKFDHLLNDR